MEALLQQLIEGQKQLFEGQKQLFEGQKQLFEGQKQLFEEQKQLFEGQKQLVEEQKKINGRLDNIDNEIGTIKMEIVTIKAEMGTKTQQDENTRLLDALMHRSEEMDAKFDGLLHNTAAKESITVLSEQLKAVNQRIDRMAMDVNFLVRKAAEHEADIFEFKKVK
jgi:uncharacterized phage infection (PIP) family protein YhgE